MSGNFLMVPGDDAIQRRSRSSSLTDLISAFDTKAQAHSDLQKVTAFSGSFDKNHKPTFSKDEYGKLLITSDPSRLCPWHIIYSLRNHVLTFPTVKEFLKSFQ